MFKGTTAEAGVIRGIIGGTDGGEIDGLCCDIGCPIIRLRAPDVVLALFPRTGMSLLDLYMWPFNAMVGDERRKGRSSAAL